MLSITQLLVKSVEINIFHVNNRRGALCLSQGSRMGYPVWKRCAMDERNMILVGWGAESHVDTTYSDAIMSTMMSQITGVSIVVRAQIKDNIKSPRHWPLWGEFTDELKMIPIDDVIMKPSPHGKTRALHNNISHAYIW